MSFHSFFLSLSRLIKSQPFITVLTLIIYTLKQNEPAHCVNRQTVPQHYSLAISLRNPSSSVGDRRSVIPRSVASFLFSGRFLKCVSSRFMLAADSGVFSRSCRYLSPEQIQFISERYALDIPYSTMFWKILTNFMELLVWMCS